MLYCYTASLARHIQRVSVSSQDPEVQWSSFVSVYHISISFITETVRFLVWIDLHLSFRADYAVWVLRIVEDRTFTFSCFKTSM